MSQMYYNKMMKKIVFLIMMVLCTMTVHSQTSEPFKGKLVNDEYQIYLKLNAYEQNITVPDQEIYGELPGYFGSKRDSRLWLVLDCEIIDEKTVELKVINDYGSEDFTARLSLNNNGTYTLKHLDGSTYKIVVDSKYVKIPKKLEMKNDN